MNHLGTIVVQSRVEPEDGPEMTSPAPSGGRYLAGASCYLGGPIEHDSAEDWRVYPKRILGKEFGIRVTDPNEDPKQKWLPTLQDARKKKDYDLMAQIARSFVRKDLCLVDRSDFGIWYLPYKVPTCGSHHEIVNSNNSKKPTLLVCPQGKELVPAWYYGFIPHDFMFGSWEDLFKYLTEVNSGKHKENNRWHYVYGMI
jgi:hypothetical protein